MARCNWRTHTMGDRVILTGESWPEWLKGETVTIDRETYDIGYGHIFGFSDPDYWWIYAGGSHDADYSVTRA